MMENYTITLTNEETAAIVEALIICEQKYLAVVPYSKKLYKDKKRIFTSIIEKIEVAAGANLIEEE